MDKALNVIAFIIFLAYVGYSTHQRLNLEKEIKTLEQIQVSNHSLIKSRFEKSLEIQENEIQKLRKSIDSGSKEIIKEKTNYVEKVNYIYSVRNLDSLSMLLTKRYE